MRTVLNPKRGCGYLKEGAFYLKGLPASEDGVLPSFVEFKEPIPTLEDHFRGYVYINGFQWEFLHEPKAVFPEGYEEGLIENMTKAMEAISEVNDGVTIRSQWDKATTEKFSRIGTELDRHMIRMAIDRVPTPIDEMNFQGHRATPELWAMDILMYVGETYYETPKDFIDECFRLGFSKRIPSPPETVWPGRTKVYFAHKKAIWDEETKEWKAGVFGYAYLSHVIWTKPRNAKKVPERIEDLERLGRVEVVELGDEEGEVDPNLALEEFGEWD